MAVEVPPPGDEEGEPALAGFPDVSLKQARTRRDEARALLADGIDPGEAGGRRRRAGRPGVGLSACIAPCWASRSRGER